MDIPDSQDTLNLDLHHNMTVEIIVLNSMNFENLRRLAASSSKVLYAVANMYIAGSILLSKANHSLSVLNEEITRRRH